jgi:hypothetical protein
MNKDILPIPKHYSDDLKNMIDMLLKKNADLRPSIIEILNMEHIVDRMKKHEYLNGTNISPVNKAEAEINYNMLNLNFENLLITEDKNVTQTTRMNTASSKFQSKIFQEKEDSNIFQINSVKNNKLSNKNLLLNNNDKNLSEFVLEGEKSNKDLVDTTNNDSHATNNTLHESKKYLYRNSKNEKETQ